MVAVLDHPYPKELEPGQAALSAECSLLGAMLRGREDTIPAFRTIPREAFPTEAGREIARCAHTLLEQGEHPEQSAVEGIINLDIVSPERLSTYASNYSLFDPKARARDIIEDYERRTRQQKLRELARELPHLPLEMASIRLEEAYKSTAQETRGWIDVSPWIYKSAPKIKYLFEGVVPIGVLAGIHGQGGLGKGYLTQELIVSAAIGKTLLRSFKPVKSMKVLWLESEDPSDELHRRFDNIANHFRLAEAQKKLFAANVTIHAGQAFPLLDKDGKPTDHFCWLRLRVRELQPSFIVIDPMVHFMQGDENDAAYMSTYMNLLKSLIDEVDGGAVVWVNHHVSKQRQNEADSAAGRGSTAIRDSMRTVFSMVPASSNDAATLGFCDTNLFVRIELTKSNYTPRSEAIYFQRTETGVLEEISSEERRREIEINESKTISNAVCDAIGKNPENLTVYEICNDKKGKLIRDAIKERCGKRATGERIRKAIEDGIKYGSLIEEKDSSGTAPRRIPRTAGGTS